MPIIFFIISLFLANQNAITITPKVNGDTSVKETTKPSDGPSDGREFVIASDTMP